MFHSFRNDTASFAMGFLFAAPGMLFAEAQKSPNATTVFDGNKLLLVDSLKFVEDTGAANRILAGDILRTLSQEVPAAVCHLHHGVAVPEATDLLRLSIAKFDAITEALRDGNDEMGILGGETARKTTNALNDVIAAWAPVQQAALAVLETPADAAAADVVFASSDRMLDATYLLLSALEGEHANPVELMQSDIMLLEVSGRMVAMTQRMAYEACRVWSGANDEKYVADLTQAKQVFELSLTALTDGMPNLGVEAAPTPEIAAALSDVADDWRWISDTMAAIVAKQDVPEERRAELYSRLAAKLHRAERIAEMYQDYSKRIF